MAPELSEILEPSRELYERIGVITSMLFYGVNFSLFIQLTAAWRGTKFNWMQAVTYTTFILASIVQSLISYIILMSSDDHFDTLDNLGIWWGSYNSRSIQLTLAALSLLTAWILDSCMLYQCFIVYSIRRVELWMMGLPLLFLFSSIGSGVYLMVASEGKQVRALPHFPLCISTKLVLTCLIAFKLLQQRRATLRMIQVENRKELIRPYTSLVRVLITSYTIYSTFSALFLGLYLSNLSVWRMVLPNAVQAGLVSHLLVRFQVAQNRHHDEQQYNEPLPFSTMGPTSGNRFQDANYPQD